MAKLSDLKTLLAKTRKPDPAPAAGAASTQVGDSTKPRIVRATEVLAEVDLRQVFADVEPLAKRNRATLAKPRPSTVPVQRLQDEAAALSASKYGNEPAPTTWDIGQEIEAEQTFLRKGLGSDVLVKLRRGHWSVQAEIDLHGMTSDEAHDLLADFLVEARQRRLRCVRVIHGKGLSSPNREPVLKGKARQWLARWGDVLAYCEAPRHTGGSGAVIVLLRS